MTAIIDAICARRSISPKRLEYPGTNIEQVAEMVRAACAAPDHGNLAPTRFIYIPDDARQSLAEVFAAATLERNSDSSQEELEDAKQRAMNGAGLIAIWAHIDENNPIAPPHEQWIAVGAATQNLLLAANSLGFHTKIVSGGRVTSKSLRAAFNLGDGDVLVGFVVLGTYAGQTKKRPRPEPGEILSLWGPDI